MFCLCNIFFPNLCFTSYILCCPVYPSVSLQTRLPASPGLWFGPGQRLHLAFKVVSCRRLGASQLWQKGKVLCLQSRLQHDFLIDSTNICGLVLPYS